MKVALVRVTAPSRNKNFSWKGAWLVAAQSESVPGPFVIHVL